MAEVIQLIKSSHSGSTLRVAGAAVAVACVVLLGVVVQAESHRERSTAQPQQPANMQTLTVGHVVAPEMRGGEDHPYRVTLTAGQHARVVLEQKGIDVVLTLFAADGKELVTVDNNLSGTSGREVLSLVADVSGAYVFHVRSLEKDASAGRYEVRIEDLRTATEADRTRVAAERSYAIAAQLQNERTRETRLKAIDQYGATLRLMREAGDKRGEAMTLTNLGQLYNATDEPQKALDQLDPALSLWQALGNRHLEAITHAVKGRVYYAIGEPLKALDSFTLAFPVMHEFGDQSGEAVTYMEIGTVYRQTGEPQKALDYFLQALPLMRTVGDRRNEAIVLNNMGTVYNLLGERDNAFHYFNQSIPIAEAINFRALKAITLTNMGSVYNLQNEPKKALQHLAQALVLTKEIGDRRTEAAVLTHTGTAYSLSGEKTKAVDFLERALALRVSVSDRQGEAVTLNHFGRAFDSWNEPQKAWEYYDKALPIWRAVGDRNGEVAALYGMARAESKRNNLLEASQRTESALKIINTQRTKVAGRNLRASYFASVQDVFKLHIDLLMRLHRRQPAAGFDVAALKAYEQARARSLIDMLAEASADIRQGVDLSLLARERALQQLLNAEADRQMRLFGAQHTEEKVVAQRRKIDDLLAQLVAVETELKAKSPRYAALTQPAPLGLAEIQRTVTDNETLLLEYSLGEERSYLWAVTPTSFASYELPPRAEIETAARRCYELLTARNQYVKFETVDEKRERVRLADAEYPQAATALSKMLLGPVAAQLGRKRLLVVPDGALEYLPFAALTVPGATSNAAFVPLMVEHEVTSIPSASTLAVLRREFQGREAAEKVVAVFADPVFDKADERVAGPTSRNGGGHHVAPSAESAVANGQEKSTGEFPPLTRLPYTRQEADAILALAPATGRKAALGFEANRAAALSEDLVNYRIIHFATHSFLNSTHPELSSIALSMLDRQAKPQNGYLRAHEIFNLRLGAELVVLSACRTGLGKEVKGEGLYGMTRGFMYAGSERVVVSLWDVQDQATARLMSDFYRGLLGPRRPHAAAALRAAQIAVWREGRWKAPYYWAGFVLQGEPQ